MSYLTLSSRVVYAYYVTQQTTLLHTASSLTDLDLSFAYMGFPGAEVGALHPTKPNVHAAFA